MHYPASELVIDPVLIRSYDVRGPRYTSYPTADRFVEAFGEAQTRAVAGASATSAASASRSSVYVHLPVLRHGLLLLRLQQGRHHATTARSAKYIKYLEQRAGAAGAAARRRARAVRSCTGAAARRPFSRDDEMAALIECARRGASSAAARTECSIEVDPRTRRAGHDDIPRRPGLQPRLARRAGLRPRGAEGGAPHPERGGHAARHRRGARERASARSTST